MAYTGVLVAHAPYGSTAAVPSWQASNNQDMSLIFLMLV